MARPPLPRALAPLTVPASWVYGAVVAMRNRRFDREVGVHVLDRPVISVGNITTGGTGKTPMVAWIARRLMEARCEPVIAMRGYKARPGEMSDEQTEYAAMLPDVAVVANPDRIGALRGFLPGHPEVKCVVLDDGFQHRQIKRDLDLVLIDATSGVIGDRLLPAGHLREPLANLRRAGAVIVTHAESEISDLRFQIERHHGRPPMAWCRHVWSGVDVFEGEGRSVQREVEWLRGKRIVTMLGVGKPQSIKDRLQRLGAIVSGDVPCRDHDDYSGGKLAMARERCANCDAMVVTGKDWVKIEKLIDVRKWPVRIVVPQLEIEFIAGEVELRDLILKTVQRKSGVPVSSPAPTR